MNSLSWVEINTANIKYNIGQARKILPRDFKIAAVVKGNAYGHGFFEVASFLNKSRLAEYLAVANDEEALLLRKWGIKLPIIVLSYWKNENLGALIKNNIEFGVYTRDHLLALKNLALKKKAKIHLKVDTGMTRLGIKPSEATRYLAELAGLKNIEIMGVYSHLAAADENNKFTNQQIKSFYNLIKEIKKDMKIPLVHIANSAGGIFMKDDGCNMMRLGLALYGLQPSKEYPALKPALTWKTKIIQIKGIVPGERISYGLTHKFTKAAKIAVLPVGYADGFDRRFSNCGEVLIKGQSCPVRGRVCMNLTMVELPNNSKAKLGDEVVLIGKQRKNEITADGLAKKIGTINYEIATRINPEIKRIIT